MLPPSAGRNRVRAVALGLLGAALALTGCRPPVLQQGEASLFQGGPLAFLEDGRTTREDVLVRLGTPNAHFEEDRVLTYAYWTIHPGTWVRQGRAPMGDRKEAPFAYRGPLDNLVLVFGADGVLTRHSLVVAR